MPSIGCRTADVFAGAAMTVGDARSILFSGSDTGVE